MSSTASAAPRHVPVLLDEVMAVLAPRPGDVVIDATFGAGGYTRALLDAGATVHAFDRDPDAIAAGRDWPETRAEPPRLVLHARRFSEMVAAMAEGGNFAGGRRGDGYRRLLDAARRGRARLRFLHRWSRSTCAWSRPAPAPLIFSTRRPRAPSPMCSIITARNASRAGVARAIVAARPLSTTGELAGVVRKALGHRPGAPRDPATRSFQAIRIHVNGELDELAAALFAAEALLTEGGRLGVVAFHSLEDRIVKRFLRAAAAATPRGSRHLPRSAEVPAARFTHLARPVRAGAAEIARNPRARSATLRAATRTAAPARPPEPAGFVSPVSRSDAA